jgi:uncharacterized membrane protein HdeD (DUF308 family)
MSEHAATPHYDKPKAPPTVDGVREKVSELTGYWWVGLVAGIAWLVISLVILQFDDASITTIGILVGCMFLLASVQNFVLASVAESAKWLWALAGVLFVVAAVVCFANPEETFAGIADMLGFLFLLLGVWWMVRAFLEKPINPAWWLGLISGVLMTCMAFWTSGQFFTHKAYILLVFAGIWALMEGINAIVRAFSVRDVHKQFEESGTK